MDRVSDNRVGIGRPDSLHLISVFGIYCSSKFLDQSSWPIYTRQYLLQSSTPIAVVNTYCSPQHLLQSSAPIAVLSTYCGPQHLFQYQHLLQYSAPIAVLCIYSSRLPQKESKNAYILFLLFKIASLCKLVYPWPSSLQGSSG